MSMLQIFTYPADILRKGAEPVERVDAELQQLIESMADTMYANAGVGLAAVQVGSDRQVIIYDVSEDRDKRLYKALLNPRIVSAEGEFLSEQEGCLSVPELRVDVNRSACVQVEALDREGNPVRVDAEDLEAVVLQHEIDHLKGVLILDKASRLKRQLYKRKCEKKARTV
ncbi:MAG: peptide deformylase [Thermodesulfobacteriota bacterium]